MSALPPIFSAGFRAYYNEHDPQAAAWLRELIRDGLIAAGDVDERDIQLVRADDIQGYRQVHLFAGIGGWSRALRLAGWQDDREVWTGSCPCQPFSAAGRRSGTADARHVWPEMRRLIEECQPPVCFGEQVASGLGRQWLAGVRADLERMGYGVGAADLCAASSGAPHIRQRLWWVANAEHGRQAEQEPRAESRPQSGGADIRLADAAADMGDGRQHEPGRGSDRRAVDRGTCEGAGGLGDGIQPGLEGCARHGHDRDQPGRLDSDAAGSTAETGHINPWSDSRWINCLDGKTRRIPIEPALFPLADGIPGRVGLLWGAGNAIVPQVAASFILAAVDALAE